MMREEAMALARKALSAAALVALLWGPPVMAQAPTAKGADRSAPAAKIEPYVILRADEVTFDENTEIATATGNVEIAYQERMLRADKVTYSKRTDTFSAWGNVVVVEPNGDVIFGNKAEFTNRFKDGFVEGFRMLFEDNSRLAATGGRRVGGVVTSLAKAVYSPCDLCKEDPSRAPLWRIRAVRVIHDNVRQDVEYKDAFLEIYGVPIAYLPYFSHPGPSVKRRSGFLIPTYGSDSDFGLTLRVPYFWAIDPSQDLLVTPVIYGDESPLLAAAYRRRFAHGEIAVDGSVTQPDDTTGLPDTRGHFFIDGRHDIDRTWRAKYQLQYASDDTYMRRYDFDEPVNQTLQSSFNIEGFRGHNYAQLSGYHFKGLRESDDSDEFPFVLPLAEYHYVSRPRAKGSYLTAQASVMALHREKGSDSRRISLKGGWHLPYTARTGEVYELSAIVQGDLYAVNDVDTGSGPENGVTGRVFPQIVAKWRYPFVRKEKNGSQLIEPIAAVVLGPNGGNPSLIPNEDSQDVEFDDTNLFSANRFTGVDRVDGGQRFVYGVNWGLYGDHGGAIEAFLGQSYHLRSNNEFPPGSGLREKASDIVGRVRISPAQYLDLLYRFRLDTDDFKAKRSDVKLLVGPSWLRANINYFFVDEETGSGEFGDREEISLGLTGKISKYWTARAHLREDLTSDGGTISEDIGFTYADECLTFDIKFERSFTRDRDLKPRDTIFFQFIFKHLGAIKGTG
ncbi:MAG: LPS assembly protein LptD [Alphaproteobacteria bacterium]|nr:LPS assembly protein LptD [Alphaproteobacteria bacterium]